MEEDEREATDPMDFQSFLESFEFKKKRPHFEVANMMEQVEPIFVQLAQKTLPHGAVRTISEKSGLNYDTLRDWRKKLLLCPEWRPYRDRNIAKRALSPEQEARLAEKIRKLEETSFNAIFFAHWQLSSRWPTRSSMRMSPGR